MTSNGLNVWIVDDDQSVRWVLEKALRKGSMATRSFERAEHVIEAFEHSTPDVLLTDIRMPGAGGLSLLARVTEERPGLPVIVMTAHSDLDHAVQAYRAGAFEYLPKPFDVDEVVELVQRAARQNGAQAAEDTQDTASPMPAMLGQAPAMQEVFRSIGRLARSSMTVLITGESGTGKELVARALHKHSPRSSRPFVALNTSAIASELLESELFGHEKGAFTGADSRRIGRFEQADGGTLFLDEIGDMSTELQTRLLRVLAESEFYRVGGQTSIKVDVRVIAATNQDLAHSVEEGSFREDLYHRLNVIRINTPPLRERREDIPMLLQHYLQKAADELGMTQKTLSDEALAALCDYDWPGNVRQLVNSASRLMVTAPGRVITAGDIPADIGSRATGAAPGADWARNLAAWARARLQADEAGIVTDALPEFEKTLIRAALERAGGKRQRAARLLGWGRNTLTRKIKSLGIE